MNAQSYPLGGGIGYTQGIVMDNLYLFLILKIGLLGLIMLFYILNKRFSAISLENKNSIAQYIFYVFFIIFNFTSLAFATRNGLTLLLFTFLISSLYANKGYIKFRKESRNENKHTNFNI